MIKKTLVAVAGFCLLSVLFFGRDAASYVRTSFGWVKDSVRSSVPVEFEIERARRMVKDLVPDIRKNMHIIAQEEVEIERLDKQIAQTEVTMQPRQDRDSQAEDRFDHGPAGLSLRRPAIYGQAG